MMRWLGLGMLTLLPLQWFVVAGTPLGMGRLHQLAFLSFAAIVALRLRPRAYAPVLLTAAPFVVLTLYMLSLWALVEMYHGRAPSGAVQQLIYLGVFFFFATYIYRAALDAEAGVLPLLRWSAAAAATGLIVALCVSMVSNGVSPVGVLQQTVTSANPEILQKELFRSSFTGYGYDEETVRGNIRHEVFGAVLLAMYISAWAAHMRPLIGTPARLAFRASMVVCVVLLTMSMSRSILIAAAAWPCIALLRSAMSLSVTRRQVLATYACIAMLGLLIVSGLGRVLWVRFTEDTSSYDSRGELYDRAFENIGANWLLGGVETAGESSHNFVLDAWLRGGVLVALAAALLLAVLVLTWLRWLRRLPSDPQWMTPVVAALALPIDRMLTSGGGLIPPVGWLTLAFVAGAAAYRLRGMGGDASGETSARSEVGVATYSQPVSGPHRAGNST